MKITKEDLQNFKSLKAILQKVKIEIQGAAVESVASVFTWTNQFEKKLEEITKDASK